jgi:hypothetical protein
MSFDHLEVYNNWKIQNVKVIVATPYKCNNMEKNIFKHPSSNKKLI